MRRIACHLGGSADCGGEERQARSGMLPTSDTPTHTLSLEQVLDRLAAHTEVDAVLNMGAAGVERNQMGRRSSDYDLLVVLTELSLPLRLVLTVVDHRLTEFYLTVTSALAALAAGERLPDGAEE